MEELFSDPDPKRAERAMQAMLGMSKIDIAALRSAADGVPAARPGAPAYWAALTVWSKTSSPSSTR